METILIYTDFSEAALAAARYGASLSGQTNASRLILYHSYPATSEISEVPVANTMDDLKANSVEQLKNLKGLLQPLAGNVLIEYRTNDKSLTEATNEIVREEKADLVVMGISEKTILEEKLTGSKTMQTAKKSPWPLLIVPSNATFEKITSAVFLTDLKNVRETTPARELKKFVNEMKAKLFVLNVDYQEKHFHPDTVLEQESLHHLLDKFHPEIHYVENKDITKGIMQFAIKHQIKLIIAAREKHTFLEKVFHKSITKELAFHSHIPLLIL